MVVHSFCPSREAEAGSSLSLRPAWPKELVPGLPRETLPQNNKQQQQQKQDPNKQQKTKQPTKKKHQKSSI